MSIKRFKPHTPGRREMTVSTFEEITTSQPEKKLVAPLKKKAGRNNYGRITVRHRGEDISVYIERLILNVIRTVFQLRWRL